MRNWKKWLGRAVAVIMAAALIYLAVLIVDVLADSTRWSSAQKDIATVAYDSFCIAEYDGQQVLLCDKAEDLMYKFLTTAEMLDTVKAPTAGRTLTLTTDNGSIIIAEDSERIVFVTIALNGKQNTYRIQLGISFDSMVKIYQGSAGENMPI